MTGFARQSGAFNAKKAAYAWVWEIKSVNGKSLDLKCRLPQKFENLNMALKNAAAQYFQRGSINVMLDLSSENGEQEAKINHNLLDLLVKAALELYGENPETMQKPQPCELLGFKGVVEVGEETLDEEEQKLLEEELLKSFELLCRSLQKDRQEEGAKIKVALLEIIDKIKDIVNKVNEFAKEIPAKMKRRLEEQITTLLAPGTQVSEDRLAQEVALYVAKADIREEIDRLKAHIKTAVVLLESEEVVGRRLDFLCQELNREANTTCSKSCDIELTNMGMELKTLIEQFREQVQNIE